MEGNKMADERVGMLAMRYVAERFQRGQIARTSATNYRKHLRSFVTVVGFDRAVRRISRRDVERWMESSRVVPSVMRTRLSTLHGFFKWAIVNGHCRTDPTVGVERPRQPRHVPRAFDPADVSRALQACAGDRERLIILLMCQEGLRSLEVAGIGGGDVNLRERLVFVTGKGGHQRILPISDETMSALVAYTAVVGLTAGPLIRNERRPDSGLKVTSIYRIAGDVLRRAGLGGKAHRLRHTCASDMLDNGANLRDVQAALGHASLGTTQLYLRLRTGHDLREAMGGRSYRVTAASA